MNFRSTSIQNDSMCILMLDGPIVKRQYVHFNDGSGFLLLNSKVANYKFRRQTSNVGVGQVFLLLDEGISGFPFFSISWKLHVPQVGHISYCSYSNWR